MSSQRPTIIHYCQHVIGVGHFFRSLELARALDWARVIMVSGGRQVPADLPPGVELFRLPGLAMPHHEGCLVPVEPGVSLGEVQAQRIRLLEDLVRNAQPEMMLVELFPFGRRLFRFELVPMIERGRKLRPDSLKVVCSLRDAVEPKFNERKIARQTLGLLNHYFNALLVHADPKIRVLDETFSRVAEIDIPLRYTGFISPQPISGGRAKVRARLGVGESEALVVASLGGGAVGGHVLEGALAAVALLRDRRPLRLLALTGPYLPDEDFASLRGLAEKLPSAQVERFAADFVDVLTAADLSLSLAGAGTMSNLLASGTTGLVWPYPTDEQRQRAIRLSALGYINLLADEDLEPQSLALRLEDMLSKAPARKPPPADFSGAQRSSEILAEMLGR